MSLITPSIAGFLASRLRRPSRQVTEDLLAEIHPEMMAQLEREGLIEALFWPVFMLGSVAAVSALVQLVGIDPPIGSIKDITFFFVSFVVGAAVLFRFNRRLPINREVRYRSLHGKWRWER